jgi:exosortase/archaeosortase family protein
LNIQEHEEHSGYLTYKNLLIASAIIFLILPVVTTFNEFLTAIVMRTQLYPYIENIFVPFLVKIVAGVLQYVFGITTIISTAALRLQDAGHAVTLYISWNCIGWQSLILFVFTLTTGLQGSYSIRSKLLTVITGLEGTFLINIFRITLICILAFYWGVMPAMLFHDYGGTILMLTWLAFFWYFSQKYVLKHMSST